MTLIYPLYDHRIKPHSKLESPHQNKNDSQSGTFLFSRPHTDTRHHWAKFSNPDGFTLKMSSQKMTDTKIR